ncbi:unnamed protein product, partial [Ectocarpus fasciculatus]
RCQPFGGCPRHQSVLPIMAYRTHMAIRVVVLMGFLAISFFTTGIAAQESETSIKRALETKMATPGIGDLEAVLEVEAVAKRVAETGTCSLEPGRLGEVEILLKRALDIQTTMLGPDDLQVSRTLHLLGVCMYKAGGRLDEAEELFKR